jgi:glutathione reductase (NADPH)
MLLPMASCGPTEAERVAAGLPTQVFETEFRPMKTAFTGGAARTRMKLLVDAASQRVEAVHMVGPDAPEIVQSLAVAPPAPSMRPGFEGLHRRRRAVFAAQLLAQRLGARGHRG